MNEQRWQEIRAGFDSIVDLDPDARAGRLAALADSDPELHRALELLLTADAEGTGDLGARPGGSLSDDDHPPDPLGIAGQIISHFDVREVLGAGGMGVVYRAHDRQLGRAVALKFLLPHYNLDASAKTRFQREAHAAGSLDHPNLCTVHEVGTTDRGWLFLAMALYEGETLRARLKRDRRLPVSECLHIARQIAEGLQAAHSAGVVHRDLKPGNVMLLPDGTVRILDFGLAKARDQSISKTSEPFGTISYMSPEQVRGYNHVDGRADLWALGVVMYEMLTGRKPFDGNEEVGVALAILQDEPALPSMYRSEISAALETIVLRLLRKDPARRYANAESLLGELARARTLADGRFRMMRTRWRRARHAVAGSLRSVPKGVLFAATGAAALVVSYLLLHSVRPSPTRAAETSAESNVAIAVVPFTNAGGDSTNLPFSDGFADELATALGKVNGLSVMSRTSAFSLKRKGLAARQIGNQLHVQYVVDGSVTRIGDRRRVRAGLIEVASGREVWSQMFDHNVLTDDVFTLEDSVTRSIVHQLLPRLSSVTVAAKRPTENREAHDLYLQGRYFFEKRDSAGLRKAQRYFRQAIATDSSYALAYTGLADAYGLQANFGFELPDRSFATARRYAAQALAHDSTLVEVHVSLAFIALFHDWDWPKAKREFETALRLNEHYAPIHLYRAWYFMATDSNDAAIGELRRAVELDPFSGLNNTRLVTILFYTGHLPEALAQARKVFERDSNFVGVHQELARVYINLGRCPEALAALQNSADQPLSLLRGVRGYTYAKCGRRAEAQAELNRLVGRARAGEYVSHYALAIIQAGLGDDDQVIAELQKAYIERAPPLFVMKLEPAFARLHSDPRFIAVARKVGLTNFFQRL